MRGGSSTHTSRSASTYNIGRVGVHMNAVHYIHVWIRTGREVCLLR